LPGGRPFFYVMICGVEKEKTEIISVSGVIRKKYIVKAM
jgi:hypothetical protein